MNYDSIGDISFERFQANQFYDYICNQHFSNVFVQFAVLLYVLSTFLSVFIDISSCYDTIGMHIHLKQKNNAL